MTPPEFDICSRARQAMVERGFRTDFPVDVLEALKRLTPAPPPTPCDQRHFLWSSIDNSDTRDLDQVEYAEKLADGSIRLRVGIADVDCLVAKDSAIDQNAGVNTTSIYTGVVTFPMVPPELSNGLSSLQQDQDRSAIVIDFLIAPSGEVQKQDVYPTQIRNRAQLTYSVVGSWLAGRDTPPPAIFQAIPELKAQLQLQWEACQRLTSLRQKHGTLCLGLREATAVLVDGQVQSVRLTPPNRAHEIIESFMVAANVAMAQFLKAKGALSIRRVVRTPERWDRIRAIASQCGASLPAQSDSVALAAFLARCRSADPERFPDLSLAVVKLLGPGEYIVEVPGQEHEGHFGLAVHDYTHSTAPNRRYADLLIQRLVKSTLAGTASPYRESLLSVIAAHCTERENAARKVERLMRKVLTALTLQKRVGEVFNGIITGSSPKGSYVRLQEVPAEGRVIRGERGIDVGDKVRVRLVSVNPSQGYIDFERI